MQYLQSQPFSVGLGTKKFQEGWDRIFAKKQEVKEQAESESQDKILVEKDKS